MQDIQVYINIMQDIYIHIYYAGYIYYHAGYIYINIMQVIHISCIILILCVCVCVCVCVLTHTHTHTVYPRTPFTRFNWEGQHSG